MTNSNEKSNSPAQLLEMLSDGFINFNVTMSSDMTSDSTVIPISCERTLISFEKEGSIRYDFVDYVIGDTIFLSTTDAGALIVYRKNDSGTTDASFITKVKITDRICDLMFAIKSNDDKYVFVFNKPDDESLRKGKRLRKPKVNASMSMATGAPVVLAIDMNEKTLELVLSSEYYLSEYCTTVVRSKSTGRVFLLMSNFHVDELKNDDDNGLPSSFMELVKFISGDHEEKMISESSSNIPFGVSVYDLSAKEPDFVSVPLNGNPFYGIVGVSIFDSSENNVNSMTIRFPKIGFKAS